MKCSGDFRLVASSCARHICSTACKAHLLALAAAAQHGIAATICRPGHLAVHGCAIGVAGCRCHTVPIAGAVAVAVPSCAASRLGTTASRWALAAALAAAVRSCSGCGCGYLSCTLLLLEAPTSCCGLQLRLHLLAAVRRANGVAMDHGACGGRCRAGKGRRQRSIAGQVEAGVQEDTLPRCQVLCAEVRGSCGKVWGTQTGPELEKGVQ